MKKIKNIFFILLTTLFLISTLALFACNSSNNIEIIGFTDLVEYAPLGSDYSVQKFITAVDKNGTPYKGTAKVKNFNGEDIELFQNMFYINSHEDYTVTVTVNLPDGNIVDRTITLKVIDKFAPVITMATITASVAGKEIEVPPISIEKRIPEEIIPEVKIFNLDENQEISIKDGKFTPLEKGNYEIVVTAKDKYGTKSQRKQTFYVYSENTLEDYSTLNAFNEDKETWMAGATKEYLSNFEGREGVIKKYNPAKSVKFKSLLTKDSMLGLDIDNIEVDLWVDFDGEVEVSNNGIAYGTIQGKCWQTINISIESILSNTRYGSWQAFCNTHSYGSSAGGQYLFNLSETATVYIDEVRFTEYVRPVPDMPLEWEIGEKIILNATANITDYSIEYTVKAPDGENVLIENNEFISTATGEYEVTATLVHEEKKGVTVFTINVISIYEIIVEDSDNPIVGTPFLLPKAKLIVEETKEEVNSEYSVKVYYNADANKSEIVTQKEGKVSFHSGDYTVVYSVDYNGKTYTLKQNYSFTETLGVANGLLEDFNDPQRVINLKKTETAGVIYNETQFYRKWHESFNGRDGVVETVTSSLGGYAQAKVNLRFGRTYEELVALLSDFDYISIWIYIDCEGYFSVASHNNRYITEASEQIVGKKWQEIRLTKEVIKSANSYYGSQFTTTLTPIQAFMECHASDKLYYQGYLFALGHGGNRSPYIEGISNDTQFKVYIDDISVGKN